MMHDVECGHRCDYPGCRNECCIADICSHELHTCGTHANEKFEPEKRAQITITVGGKTVKAEVVCSATLEWDNMLNVARAADQLVHRAFFGPW